MRTARLTTVVLLMLAVPASPASAKERVRAKLDGTVRLGAAPGTAITIRWRLVDANGRPFGASGIYLRLSRCGGATRRVNARSLGGGRFSARVVVPARGIRELRVGLEGWSTEGGDTRRADVFFGFDPPLVRRCA